MLFTIIALFLTLLTLAGAGTLLYGTESASSLRLTDRMIGGFFAISCVAMICNLFVALGGAFFQSLMIASAVFGGWTIWHNRIRWKKSDVVLHSLLFFACAVLGNRGWMHIDSGGYHNQMVKWLIESPVPFGLGNLHTRYAFNSVWHTFSAALAFPGFGISGSYSSGAALAFVLVSGLLTRLQTDELRSRPGHQAFVWAVFSGLTIVHAGRRVIESQIGSPSTDFPAAAFVLIFFVACLDAESAGEETPSVGFTRSMSLLAPLILAVTTKLSVAPIALALLPFLLRLSRRALALSIAFCAIWILRTYVLSGCWVYPMAVSCLPKVRWAMPFANVDGEYQALHIWGRVTPPPSDPAIIHSWFLWIPLWAKQAFTEPLAVAWSRFVLIASAVIGFGVLRTRGRVPSAPSRALAWVGVASVVALVFWFFQAPALRYGFGPIIATAAFAVSLSIILVPEISAKVLSSIWIKRWSLLCFALFSFQALYNAKGIKPRHFLENWPKFPAVETIPAPTLHGNTMSSPKKDGLCWNAPLETRCTPTPVSQVAESRRWGRPEFYLEP